MTDPRPLADRLTEMAEELFARERAIRRSGLAYLDDGYATRARTLHEAADALSQPPIHKVSPDHG